MTVAQLIEELLKQPQHAPVRVLMSEVYGIVGEFNDECPVSLEPKDALEADRVSWEGNHVLVRSRCS